MQYNVSNTFFKNISLVMLVALTLNLLSSCNQTKQAADTSDESKITQDIESTAVTEEFELMPDEDYNNHEFVILTTSSDHIYYQYDVETENGEIVNDAILNRNRAVEEKYNIQISQLSRPSDVEVTNTM